MKNWIILLILTAAYIAVCVACFSEPQRRAQSERKVVSLPKALFWVGLLTGCVFLVHGPCRLPQHPQQSRYASAVFPKWIVYGCFKKDAIDF